jgi:hypothetical protein
MQALDVLPLAFAAFAIGGTLKGMLGFGLPLATMSLLSAFLDVPTAVALNALPVLVSNLFQANRGGLLASTVRRFWPLLITLAAGTWAGATLIVVLDPRWLLGILGVIVVSFCAISHYRPGLKLPPRAERPVGAAVGLAAGVMGGISTILGPPLIIYVTSLRLDKEAFVAALGTFFLMSGVFITLSFVERGVLDAATAPWSLACVPPVLAGMWLGRRLGRRIDQERFRRIVLIVLFVLGLNLLRRAIF